MFKVGQVWKNRKGDRIKITGVLKGDAYPVKSFAFGALLAFTTKGNYRYECDTPLDLIELVEDPPKFKVGQVWRRLDGKIVTIERCVRFKYGAYSYTLRIDGEDDHYTENGNHLDDDLCHDKDLIVLIKEPTENGIL